MTQLTIQGLTRRPWFEGVNHDLSPGEILVVTGPSGSGKTLFLRAIADLDPAEGGTVTLGGEDRASMEPSQWRRQVIYVHQSTSHLPGTVGDNLDRVTQLQRFTQHSRKDPPPAIERCPPRSMPVHQLSGGESQRLALARALSLDPDVLLLDEITSSQDKDTAKHIENTLVEWAALGRVILWVSHDPQLAQRIGGKLFSLPTSAVEETTS